MIEINLTNNETKRENEKKIEIKSKYMYTIEANTANIAYNSVHVVYLIQCDMCLCLFHYTEFVVSNTLEYTYKKNKENKMK